MRTLSSLNSKFLIGTEHFPLLDISSCQASDSSWGTFSVGKTDFCFYNFIGAKDVTNCCEHNQSRPSFSEFNLSWINLIVFCFQQVLIEEELLMESRSTTNGVECDSINCLIPDRGLEGVWSSEDF